MPIYSLQVEKHALGGLIRHSEMIPEVDGWLTEHDFYNDVHSTIFSVLVNCNKNGEKIDKVLLGQKIKNLGVSFKDEINIFDYINSISFTQITPKATLDACKELGKLRVRRELYLVGGSIQNAAKINGEKSIDEIIGEIDKIYGEKISAFDLNDEPVNIFADIEKMVEERGNNPVNEVGLITSFSEFNRLYGGLKGGNIYAIISRAGQGKSTWINDICFKTSQLTNFKVPALILDTEMSTQDTQWRRVSAMTGVGMWYLETGNWRRNEEMVKKVRPVLKEIEGYKLHHYRVGSKSIDQVCSIVRRWFYKYVGRGNKAIIAYDYIKLTGEKLGNNYAEHQAIGDKIDKLKRLSEELNVPIITAMQQNRSGENFNRKSSEIQDDASTAALSDRLSWFGTWVSIFRRKSFDEIALDGEQFGTHKMINLKARFQGKDATGHHDLVKRMIDGESKLMNNYVNYQVSNFSVEERGSLRDIVAKENEKYDISQPRNSKDGDIL